MEAGTTMIKRCGKATPGVGGLTGRLLGNRGAGKSKSEIIL
jgi:hypothetical protein